MENQAHSEKTLKEKQHPMSFMGCAMKTNLLVGKSRCLQALGMCHHSRNIIKEEYVKGKL